MTVERLQREMSSREFSEWMVVFKLDEEDRQQARLQAEVDRNLPQPKR